MRALAWAHDCEAVDRAIRKRILISLPTKDVRIMTLLVAKRPMKTVMRLPRQFHPEFSPSIVIESIAAATSSKIETIKRPNSGGGHDFGK